MKKLLLLISIMFLASCATKDVFNVEHANTYLMSHKARPAHIKEALSVGNLAEGMNEEEVEICWGKPDRIVKRYMPPYEIQIWRYFENRVTGFSHSEVRPVQNPSPKAKRNSDGRVNGSSIIRTDIRKKIIKEVTFRDGIVTTWTEVDR